MAPSFDLPLDLDGRRRQLEDNATKLRKALQHWRKLDAEYEELKEEILARKNDPNAQDLEDIGARIGGSLLDKKEIKALLGGDHSTRRSSKQMVNVVSRRIDCKNAFRPSSSEIADGWSDNRRTTECTDSREADSVSGG